MNVARDRRTAPDVPTHVPLQVQELGYVATALEVILVIRVILQVN